MSRKTMTKSERFFWQHAGYSFDPTTEGKAQGRRRCAEYLAAGEAWAEEQGVTFTWEYDPDVDLSFMTESEQAEPHDAEVCIARYADGTMAGCFGGIIDADRNYRRVVEAELAADAQHEAMAALLSGI